MKNELFSVKKIIRFALLIFVIASVSYLIAKEGSWNGGATQPQTTVPSTIAAESTPATPDHVTAYYFHGNFRCASCRKIEEYSKAAINEGFVNELKDGKLKFNVVNVEESPNRHFIRDYSLVTKSLVLVLKDGEREVRFKNLELVWQFLSSREKFVEYVQNEVRTFLAEVKR